ncbi:hypothetical protein, partial [Actinomadura sp. 6K520]|uniref:hypothetical protein n=1 Tax=Actinomadura sp. 6K520 TaxID=2530364 RepID=UPI0032610747
MDGDSPPSTVIRGLDRDLQMQGAFVRDDQRAFERQLLDVRSVSAGARVQCHFDKAASGDQHRIDDGVVVEPSLGFERKPSGEKDCAGVRYLGGGRQDRMARSAESEAFGVLVVVVCVEPVGVVLEGVGGEWWEWGVGGVV